ncbi:MAG: hypothetical protein B6D38_09695 [Anaerolineae bacterium UTCFX1]|jgi:D-alanine-D-alanine ligase|nr:MAG: hypothetical protein B6D38_09695 [Anaerolineae bacterium UTCFX1]
MRVCLLTDEIIEEFDPSIYLKNYVWDYVTVLSPSALKELTCANRYDMYINLYEGYDDSENSGLQFVRTLEELNLPFTGAEAKFYGCTREEMQAAADARQIRFARGFHAETFADLEQADSLPYPLIVKHPNSFASAGLTKESRVTNSDELKTQFERMSQAYGSARVEEFIEGRELSCLVVEDADDSCAPFAYPPAEMQFPEGETFLHEFAKWYNWDIFVVPLDDDALAARIQDVSRKFFIAMGGNGYARLDLRVRPDGEIVIIEINPNCGVLYSNVDDRSPSDLAISWDAAGHDGFLERIFRAAIKRQALRAKVNS